MEVGVEREREVATAAGRRLGRWQIEMAMGTRSLIPHGEFLR
jgi:hypothetical protein